MMGSDRKAEIALVGRGLLADAAETVLDEQGSGFAVGRFDLGALASISSDAVVVVVASDAWDTTAYPEVRRMCTDRGIPWLPVRTELGRVVVGPVEFSGAIGCGECADSRRRLARLENRPDFEAVWQRNEEAMTSRPSSWLSDIAADLVAEHLLQELRDITENPAAVRTAHTMIFLDLRTLHGTAHNFLPDPTCNVCGDLPSDSFELASIVLAARRKLAPDNYRVRDLASEMATLEKMYVDAEAGLVPEMRHGSKGGLALAEAPMGLHGGRVESGYGRTSSYRDSELVALLEALERYGSGRPGGKRTSVWATYRELGDRAIDPRRLGTHPEESYLRPGFPFQRFHESVQCRWVWAHSFARGEPVLVPESYAYYDLPHLGPESHPFMLETSNGCAIGGCLEEAIFHGVLEVAERDAFLLTWYAKMSPPRIDLSSSIGDKLPIIVGTIQAETGYEVMLLDITVEQQIPCVWAMAVHPSGAEPTMVCAAGSHPCPEKAAENALSELAPLLVEFTGKYPSQRRQAESMAGDPFLVREMGDHLLVNATLDAFDRSRFIVDSPQRQNFPDMVDSAAFRHNDLSADLRGLISRYVDSGLDVIVVDQTTPEHRAADLACVKVIIPGALPMTFGHEFRRIEGLDRLFYVPQLIGHRDRALQPEDLNMHPHPFP